MTRTYKPDKIRVDNNDWSRSFRGNVCEICGCEYWEHQPVSGYEWLFKLCDGELVKL